MSDLSLNEIAECERKIREIEKKHEQQKREWEAHRQRSADLFGLLASCLVDRWKMKTVNTSYGKQIPVHQAVGDVTHTLLRMKDSVDPLMKDESAPIDILPLKHGIDFLHQLVTLSTPLKSTTATSASTSTPTPPSK